MMSGTGLPAATTRTVNGAGALSWASSAATPTRMVA